MKKTKGKLIVIDGTDGSGKATQVALLSKRLQKEGYKIKNVDFPEYYKNFFGKFIGECLSDEKFNFINTNQIHQGGKIHSAKERKEFLSWLDQMEYSVFKIPKPDVVLYLSLPISIVNTLIAKRDSKGSRAYKGNKKDVHESDPTHLENARKSALKLVKELNNFVQIDCAPKKELLSIESVHELVYKEIKKIVR